MTERDQQITWVEASVKGFAQQSAPAQELPILPNKSGSPRMNPAKRVGILFACVLGVLVASLRAADSDFGSCRNPPIAKLCHVFGPENVSIYYNQSPISPFGWPEPIYPIVRLLFGAWCLCLDVNFRRSDRRSGYRRYAFVIGLLVLLAPIRW